MKVVTFLLILTTGLLTPGIMSSAILLWSRSANAQVTSDGTTNTTVNPNGNNFTILNGSEKGSNLFHSFSNFSVPTGTSATFDLINTPNISTIFSRVTGGKVSNIDGLIQTINSNNPVSLFLMNPAGIVFGQNAALNIGGSFVGTTANSIKFADGTEFSAVNPTGTPLLTMSVPIGLQMGTNPEAIKVDGTGHNLTKLNPLNSGSPINPQTHLTGLQLEVKPGKTLALIGGDINLIGGTLQAISGRIELGAVAWGIVSLNPGNQGWTFGYDRVQSFRDISFSQQALADASGFGGGAIQIQGAHVSFIDGSLALIQNLGVQPSGGINIRASESLEVIGVDPNRTNINSGVRNETLGAGNLGDITITTRQLVLEAGGTISSATYGSGASGTIAIETTDSLKLLGFSPISNSSGIDTTTYSSGYGGDVNISTRELTLLNGGSISSASLGTGNAGNVAIKATDLVELSGFRPGAFIPSSISSPSLFTGNAGSVTINTKKLLMSNGGTIDSSITGSGKGGNLVINATDSIEVRGTIPGSRNPSRIGSSGIILDEPLRLRLRLPPAPTGDSGSLTINTGKLSVTDGALVNVQNEGSGNAGALRINANSIFLNNGGSITASTKSGEGGNINLQVRDTLLIRRGSQISADASGIGNGGNITINAPFLIGLENSDIIANAVQGDGGNIQITTEGIFGLAYRPQLTPNSDITASSQFGVNGTVDINNFGVDPSSGLVELPANLSDPSQQIASGCSANQGSRFVATGRGGVPQNPHQQVANDRPWSDTRDISAYRQTEKATAQIPAPKATLVQATSWHRNAQGKIELVADKFPAQMQQTLTCAAVSKN
ncbi:MAG: S-layer family protein [Nostoc sp. NMS1]|uniref:S-layer family protein n=1 Tax=unclassified Nostoc TaxID=2593658 RepID=UPI0025E51A44|nr:MULTISPECIES: S-layer family protein [unclassified Nostoc]MBN3906523.1 S-layer family protein [Nostoc sp. NMS1]MBN3993092.1 S-layer family protein [Nostoc sp. NMS2]